jgi:hypothetical protein
MGILIRASMSLDGYSTKQIVGTSPCPGALELRETLRVV